jgi:hypothetical protein
MATRRRSRRKTISGNLTDIQKRIRYLETRPAAGRLASKAVASRNLALRAVDADIVADNAIIRRSIAAAAVGTGQIEQDSITNALIATNAVNADSIEPGAVGTTEIATDAVTTDKIATDAITNNELATNSVNADSIAPGSVGENELADSSVTTGKINSAAITTDKIDNAAITTAKIGDLEVTDEKIDGISGEKIIGGIDGNLINNGTVDEDKISGVYTTTFVGLIESDQIDELDGSKLVDRSVDSLQIAGDSISTFHLDTDAVYNENIIENAVYGRGTAFGQSSILNASINGDDMAFGAVGPSELADLAVERRHMSDSVIIARMINAGAVQTAGIQNLAVTTAKINDGAVTTEKIGNAEISFGKLSATAYGPIVNNGMLAGTGITKTVLSGSQPAAGKVQLSVNTGSGASQAAEGNHVHGTGGYSAAGSSGVPSHTHPVSINDTSTSNGSHGGHSTSGGGEATRGAHTHVVGISGNTGAPSTIKLKKEVTDYSMVDVKNLLNLNLKRYKYKNQVRHLQEGREWMYGYIAEEVEQLGIEEIVGYDENKEPNAINYSLLSTLVLELVKVQQTEIDSLKEEIQRLKEKI